MTLATVRQTRALFASLAVACIALAGCHDDSFAPKMIPTPAGPMGDLGTTIVDVNLKTGVVTTHPLASGSLTTPEGVSAAIYGATALVHHVFQLENGTQTGTTYVFDEQIENNLPFAIGTHVPHTAPVFPEDTMGVFVFISIGPTVTAGCQASPTCKVAVDSGYDGQFPFTSPTAQKYSYFKTILEASDGNLNQGLDFTDQSPANGGTGIKYFRKLPFRVTGGVTDFVFGVTVSAAWVKPNESQWKVTYVGDSLPNRVGTSLADLRSEQDWRESAQGGIADTSIANAFCAGGAKHCLRIQSGAPALNATEGIEYFRSDSVGASDSAFMDATVAVSNLEDDNPSVFFGMQDRVKSINFGIAGNAAGFLTSANTFVAGGSALIDPSTVSTWRIKKFLSDSVVAFANGTRLVALPYSSLDPAPVAAVPNHYFEFGHRVTFGSPNPTNVTSLWSAVSYTIGRTSP